MVNHILDQNVNFPIFCFYGEETFTAAMLMIRRYDDVITSHFLDIKKSI